MQLTPCRRAAYCGVVVWLTFGCGAHAQDRGCFRGLGILPGWETSEARAVSADGRVAVGYCTRVTPSRRVYAAVRWWSDGRIEQLSSDSEYAAAWGCSEDGTVVVGEFSDTGGTRAVQWLPGGQQVTLAVPPGTLRSGASGVSHDGLSIAGYITSPDHVETATIWRLPEGPELLPLPAGITSGQARAISADGSTLVGSVAGPAVVWDRASRWVGDADPSDLGLLPDFRQSWAFAVSGDGSIVVGECLREGPGLVSRAFRWTSSTGMQDLGSLPGSLNSSAWCISADGRIISGRSWHPITELLWVWSMDAGMTPLSTHLSNYAISHDGWILNDVFALSKDGSTLVGGGVNPTGQQEAWVAKLHTCPADLNGDCFVDFADYLEFLNLYDAQDLLADFNADGLVDFADYLDFLNHYDAGC